MQPSFDAGTNERLGVRQRDVMDGDGDVTAIRFLEDRSIDGRRQRLLGPAPGVDPKFDEFGPDRSRVLNGQAGFLDGRDRIGYVGSRRVALGSGARPGDPGTGGAKQRRAWDDLFPHAQGHVAPVGPATAQVGTAHEIANADDRADSVVGGTLEMIDQILARVGLLRHGPFGDVLESEVAVQVHHGRHHGLARQVNASDPFGDREFAAAADLGELVVLDKECGVLNRRAAVAGDQPRAFKYRGAGGSGG